MSDSVSSLAVLGTRWTEFPTSKPRRRGFLGLRSEQVERTVSILDWTIDGRPLRDRLGFADVRPCIEVTFMSQTNRGWDFTIESLRALLLENESGFDPWVQFTDGRAGILFCPQCGDLDCGAVSADVRFKGSVVEWRDVAYQNGFTDGVFPDDPPAFSLRFDRAQYEATVRALLADWSTPAQV